MLQYHSAICEMLGIPPIVSPLRLEVLAECEHFCCTELPAAVIEWFAIADVEIWFHRHTNQDHLVNIQELGMGEYKQIAQGWLFVAGENQGVVQWFCKLDGSDDPSVWNDDSHYFEVPFTEIPWVENSDSFSGFIFDSLAVSRYKSWQKGLYIKATSPDFSNTVRDTLQSHFRQGPFSERDKQKVYRFYNERALIYVYQGEPSDEVRWAFFPASQDDLREILALLKPSRDWLNNWKVDGWEDELGSLAGQRVLDEYRTSSEIVSN